VLARVIKTIEDFERIKENWDAVYSADPHTTFFVSWPWMLGWIKAWTGFTTEEVSHDWEIVGITPDAHSPYVAFMPICTTTLKETGFALSRNLGIKTIYIGGYPWSDHTGFICQPEYVERAVPLFATHLQRHMQWDIFDIRNIFDPRCDLLLKCFNGKKYMVKEVEGYPCPYIVLPDNWETYLQQYLGASTRRSLKYDTRKIQSLSEFHITHVNAENLESQIETLLTLYQTRWGQKTEPELNRFRLLFKTCFEHNSLWLDILWDGSVAIAGFAVYLDHKIKSFTTYTIASNKKYAKWSPGAVMVGYSIRYAIENGFRIFDLGTGDEGYKYSFGSTDRRNRNIVISNESSIRLKVLMNKATSMVPGKLKSVIKTALLQK